MRRHRRAQYCYPGVKVAQMGLYGASGASWGRCCTVGRIRGTFEALGGQMEAMGLLEAEKTPDC